MEFEVKSKIHIITDGGGLAQLVAMPGPVSTWMGDHPGM